MNLQQLESRRVQAMAQIFLEAARHVPPDKADWKPDPKAKSAHEIVSHLAKANGLFLNILRGEPLTGDTAPDTEGKSYEDSLEEFEGSARELAEAIASLPDGRLGEQVELPWGQVWKLPMVVAAAGGHIAYHWGQIGYLQTLWGDATDYHLLPRSS